MDEGINGGMVGFLRETSEGYIPIWFNWSTVADLKVINEYAIKHKLSEYPASHFAGQMSLVPSAKSQGASTGKAGHKPVDNCPQCGGLRWLLDKKKRWWYCSAKDHNDEYCGYRYRR